MADLGDFLAEGKRGLGVRGVHLAALDCSQGVADAVVPTFSVEGARMGAQECL
jgi:hypothetical protein